MLNKYLELSYRFKWEDMNKPESFQDGIQGLSHNPSASKASFAQEVPSLLLRIPKVETRTRNGSDSILIILNKNVLTKYEPD